jgi:hypothetical protein
MEFHEYMKAVLPEGVDPEDYQGEVMEVDPEEQYLQMLEEQDRLETDYARKKIAWDRVASARKALRTDLFPLVDLQDILIFSISRTVM